MSGRGSFRIPSITEMKKPLEKPIQAQSLFERHKKGLASDKDIRVPATKPASVNGSATAASKYLQNTATQGSKTVNTVKSSPAATATIIPPKPTNTSSALANNQSKKTDKSTVGLGGNQSKLESTSTGSKIISTDENAAKNSSGNDTKNGATASPPRPAKSNSIIVSSRQRGNPILKSVRNVPWEFGDIVPDYVMGQTSCGLFLSLRYHNLNPNYIHERLKQLGHSYDLRVLLVQVDVKDPHHALKDLAKMCILADCTLILAWSPEEAGRYLETYKAFENKPPDLIMEKTEQNYLARVTDCLTSVKKVNKTDASTLLTTFGSVEKVIKASEEDLSLCPGFGPQKAKRLHDVFHEPFLKTRKRKADESKEAEDTNTKNSKSPIKSSSPLKSSPLKKR